MVAEEEEMGELEHEGPLDSEGLRGEQTLCTWHPAPVLCHVPAS